MSRELPDRKGRRTAVVERAFERLGEATLLDVQAGTHQNGFLIDQHRSITLPNINLPNSEKSERPKISQICKLPRGTDPSQAK